MKRKSIYSVFAGSLVAFSTMTSAATIVNGGKINFTGEVVNGACAVSLNSSGSIDVLLGTVKASTLNRAGDTSGNVKFDIVLKDCASPALASMAFNGLATGTTPGGAALDDVLTLSGGSAGMAKNVGIQIFSDSDTTPLKVNGLQFSTPKELNDGENVFPFVARYFATGPATAGRADAVADFTIKYE